MSTIIVAHRRSSARISARLRTLAHRTFCMVAAMLLFTPLASVEAQSVNLSAQTHTAIVPVAAAIRVGGAVMNLHPGQLVTPAELTALNQVLATGRQSLVLGGNGTAIGGSLSIGNGVASMLSSLVIPKNVKVLDNFGQTGTLNLTGSLTNSGDFYAYSTNPSVTGGTISADSIINNANAVISSILPSSLGIHGAIPQFNLTLQAPNIVNAGTISSSGNVNLTAANNALVVDNTGGVISALKGSINVRDALYNGSASTTLVGGNWLSQQLNLFGGLGTIEANLNQVTGVVSTAGNVAHFVSATPNLTLGNTSLTGDPTYYNTQGSITIAGNITVGENLAIIAKGDITSSTAVSLTANDGTNGDNISLIAGANLSSGGGADQTSPLGPIPGSTPNGPGGVQINGASTAGGKVSLASGSSINAQAVIGNGVGGNILIAAFGGTGATSGGINLTGVNLNTSASGTGSAGNVSIVGGAVQGNAINVGNITAAGGSTGGNGGSVSVIAAQPTSSDDNPVIFDAHGSYAGQHSASRPDNLCYRRRCHCRQHQHNWWLRGVWRG